MAERQDSAKQMPRVLSGSVRRTTKHRRFLTLYTVPADFFMSIDSPGGRALGHRM